jgi:hypothetical protein
MLTLIYKKRKKEKKERKKEREKRTSKPCSYAGRTGFTLKMIKT